MASFAFNYGGWIGLIFTEFDGYTANEILAYNVEHYLVSFLGVVVLSLSGRFDILSYRRWENFFFGWLMFTLYMRLFLTPIALSVWANLNHTLCGTNTDPIWLIFDLGKWYYLAGEFSLGLAAAIFMLINYTIATIVKRYILGDKSCSHGIHDQSE